MKNYSVMILLVFVLSACGGGGDSAGYGGSVEIHPVPTLVSFDVVDSYGVDTASSHAALTIDPYKDNGLFDIFWRVNSLEDYQVRVYMNDTAGISNGILFYSEICGLGHRCDQGGNVICQYTSDLYLSCNNSNHQKDIAALFRQVPESLYMVMEICDMYSANCTYRYYPVLMQ